MLVFVTKWFFLTCLAIQVKAQADVNLKFTEFLVDEAVKKLQQKVDDPTVLPTVEVSTDVGSVKLENGKIDGLKTFARTESEPVGELKVDGDKAMLAAFIGVEEASARYDASIAIFGIEGSTEISVSIQNLQILLLAEMNLQNVAAGSELWDLWDFKIIPDWPFTVISVEGGVDGAEYVEEKLMDQLIDTVEPSLIDQFQKSLNDLDVPSLLDQFLSAPNSPGVSDELLNFIEQW